MVEKIPEMTQTQMESPTDPVFIKTPLGDTKIPDPMMDPTITVQPFKRDIFGLRQILSSPGDLAAGAVSGSGPFFVWEAAPELSGSFLPPAPDFSA